MNKFLKSRAGASIALALFYLIICSVLSMLIITISTVDSTKSINYKQEEQAKLLILSLFNNVNDEIGKKDIECEIIAGDESLKALLKSQNIYLLNEVFSDAYIYVCETNEDCLKDFEVEIENCKLLCSLFMNSRDMSITISVSSVIIDDRNYDNLIPSKMIFVTNHIEKNISTFYSVISYDKGVLK